MPKTGPSTVDNRISRIEGQIKGISKMLQDGEDIEKIMIQIKAVTSSLESMRIELLKNQMKKKILQELDSVVELLK